MGSFILSKNNLAPSMNTGAYYENLYFSQMEFIYFELEQTHKIVFPEKMSHRFRDVIFASTGP